MKILTLAALLFTATLRLGARAPNFALPDTRGKRHALADVKAKVVALNFWAFWCDTWKDELPLLTELAAQQEREGFALLAISVDGRRVEQFQARTGGRLPFPVLLDEGGRVSRAYNIAHVPTVVILDAARRVRYCERGVPKLPTLLREIRRAAGNPR